MNEAAQNTGIFEKTFMETAGEYFFDPETEDFIKPYALKALNARSGHILTNIPQRFGSEKPIPASELAGIMDALKESGQMKQTAQKKQKKQLNARDGTKYTKYTKYTTLRARARLSPVDKN